MEAALEVVNEPYTLRYGDAFDVQNWTARLPTNITVNVSGGVGIYRGPKSAAEYLAIASLAINRNWWDSANVNQPLVSPDLSDMTQSDILLTYTLRNPTQFFAGRLFRQRNVTAQLVFENCSTKVMGWNILNSPSFAEILRVFVWTANFSQYHGKHDNCMLHELMCTKPPYKQFDNFSECMRHMDATPIISERCGEHAPMAGRSRACYFKHKFMVPFDQMHCFHLKGVVDLNGEAKCTDDYECPDASGHQSVIITKHQQPNQDLSNAQRAYDADIASVLPSTHDHTDETYKSVYRSLILGQMDVPAWTD